MLWFEPKKVEKIFGGTFFRSVMAELFRRLNIQVREKNTLYATEILQK